MRKLPIPFSAPMVLALLREIEHPGTGKTQTRRVIEFPGVEKVLEFVPVATDKNTGQRIFEMKDAAGQFIARPVSKQFSDYHYSPRYAVGDRLYVREAWRTYSLLDGDAPRDLPKTRIWYEADAGYKPKSRFRQGMHMPRWASRITLTVTDVRMQRLQEISEADAIAEGAPLDPNHRDCTQDGSNPHMVAVNAWTRISPVAWYHRLWDSLNADRGFGWNTNPWVAAYTFTARLGNIDAEAA